MPSNNTPFVNNNDRVIWLDKELKQLHNSAIRLALLAVIDKYKKTGIHGYTIGEQLYSLSEGEFDSTKATFYAILRRLEKDGLVSTSMGYSTVGPPRKYYRLTDDGEKTLQVLWNYWKYYYGTLDKLFRKLVNEDRKNE